MSRRILSTTVLTAVGTAMVGGALAFAPAGQADPGSDTNPPCLAEGTCKLLVPKAAPRYLPLTPKSDAPQQAPLTPKAQ